MNAVARLVREQAAGAGADALVRLVGRAIGVGILEGGEVVEVFGGPDDVVLLRAVELEKPKLRLVPVDSVATFGVAAPSIGPPPSAALPAIGSATLTSAATGVPAIAAMSDTFTAIALRPTSSGACTPSARRKWRPSMSMSVVISQPRPSGGLSTIAQSSPIPSRTSPCRLSAP